MRLLYDIINFIDARCVFLQWITLFSLAKELIAVFVVCCVFVCSIKYMNQALFCKKRKKKKMGPKLILEKELLALTINFIVIAIVNLYILSSYE